MKYHVYVSNAGANKLSKFVMDAESGKLDPEEDIELDAPPGAVAVDRQERFLYVCLRKNCQFSSFQIDKSTGRLAPINSVVNEAGSCYIKTDNTDRYLLSAYYGAGRVAVHAINADGSLQDKPIQWVATAEHAHSIQTDRSNQFVFVPHTNPPNMIAQFKFDEGTGRLTRNDPPSFVPETSEGPRHFCFHPELDILYSVNEDASSVTAHHFDTHAGTLAAFQLLSTLPDDFDGDNSCAEIKITPSGKFLFASNRGHDSIARFAVDPGSGELTALGHEPTEKTPRMFNLDPSGRFLYCAGQSSGTLASYKISQETGELEPMEVHTVGETPLWVQFVKMSS